MTCTKLAPIRSTVNVTEPFAPVRLAPVSVNGEAVPQVGVEILNDNGTWECIYIQLPGLQLFSNSLAQQTARENHQPVQVALGRRKDHLDRSVSQQHSYRSDQIVDLPVVGDAVSLVTENRELLRWFRAKFRIVLMHSS